MNTFKVAVAGASARPAGSAHGRATDGLGNVLLYPYYTVREPSAGNAYNSLLSVVNSSRRPSRSLPRRQNSREVLDFYACRRRTSRSRPSSRPPKAAIVTPDYSCTDPMDDANPTHFVNYAYTGAYDDPANDDLDRTREGYVEIIEMGTMWGYAAGLVTHKAGTPRVPANCATTSACSLRRATSSTTSRACRVACSGRWSAINVGTGMDGYGDRRSPYDGELYEAPGSIEPTLNRADPISLVVDHGIGGGGGHAHITTWNIPGNKPVDRRVPVLMHDHIYNEFDKGTASGSTGSVTHAGTKGVPDAYYLLEVRHDGQPGDKELKVTRLFRTASR